MGKAADLRKRAQDSTPEGAPTGFTKTVAMGASPDPEPRTASCSPGKVAESLAAHNTAAPEPQAKGLGSPGVIALNDADIFFALEAWKEASDAVARRPEGWFAPAPELPPDHLHCIHQTGPFGPKPGESSEAQLRRLARGIFEWVKLS